MKLEKEGIRDPDSETYSLILTEKEFAVEKRGRGAFAIAGKWMELDSKSKSTYPWGSAGPKSFGICVEIQNPNCYLGF